MAAFIVEIKDDDMVSLRKRGVHIMPHETDENLISEIIAETLQSDGFLDPYNVKVIKIK